MGIHTLSLRSFRNYGYLVHEFNPGLNLIHGANGQGKTNLLEALYLLSTGRLLKGQRDSEAIFDGAEHAEVEAEVTPNTKLSIVLQAGTRKRIAVNDSSLPRAADLLGRLPCVCVSSADLPIVAGDPSDRRLFIDLELSALYPKYLQAFTHYKRALDQRNALLKDAQMSTVASASFEPWEDAMATAGASMRQIRLGYVADLDTVAAETQSFLGNGESLSVRYALRDPSVETDAFRGGAGYKPGSGRSARVNDDWAPPR